MRHDNATEQHTLANTTRLSYGLLVAPWVITGLGEFLGLLWYVYALMAVPFAAFLCLVLLLHNLAGASALESTNRDRLEQCWALCMAVLALVVSGAVVVCL